MNTYRDLAEPHFEEVFGIIDKCCIKCNIHHFLIGAQARDIHILETGNRPMRQTLDIDFAVMVPEIAAFDELKNEMLKNGFESSMVPHRLIHAKTNTEIDLLPFGEVEQKRTVNFDDRVTELSVIGLKEISDKTIEYNFKTVTLKVSPLEGLFILKLISNNEKPERTNDLDDIKIIIDSYFDLNRDRIYDDYLSHIIDMETENYELHAGALALGIDVGKIINESNDLNKLIISILGNEINSSRGSICEYLVGKEHYASHESAQKLFTLVNAGIEIAKENKC